jgi:hypothetical protein
MVIANIRRICSLNLYLLYGKSNPFVNKAEQGSFTNECRMSAESVINREYYINRTGVRLEFVLGLIEV